MRHRKSWLPIGLLAIAAAAGLLGGAEPAASAESECPPPAGRQFCVTVTDIEPVSASTDGVTAYERYTITVANAGGSALTNGVATVTLLDVLPTGRQVSSALYLPAASTPICSRTSTSPNVVTCAVGNLAAGASTTFALVYRTSTTPGVLATDAEVLVAFKEKLNDNAGSDPNPDTGPAVVERTSYEPEPNASFAFSPPGNSVVLKTAPVDDTFTTFAYFLPPGKQAFVASLAERPATGPGELCAPGLTCFGQVVRTDVSGGTAQGAFGADSLLSWTISWSTDILPPRVNERTVVIVHTLDDGTVKVISERCSTVPPSGAEVLAKNGCLVASIDRRAKLLTVTYWDFENGFGRGG